MFPAGLEMTHWASRGKSGDQIGCKTEPGPRTTLKLEASMFETAEEIKLMKRSQKQ